MREAGQLSNAGVRAAKVQAQAAVANGVELEAKALEINLFLGDVVGVVGTNVVQTGGVVVVARLGEHDPFRPDVDADAVNGGDFLTEEGLLVEGSAVNDVQIHLHALELQLVAQSDAVDELARLVFDHVDGIGRLERAIAAVPHEVVSIDALHGRIDEGRVAHLDEHVVLARIVLVIQGRAHRIAAYGVPKLGAVVDVDGVGIVLPAADSHNLLTRREEKIVGEVPVEVSPVGALEKGVGKVDVGRVEALAQVVGELLADGAV